MTPQKWIEATNAIGIVSKAGRNGGTYAHKDIALEFCSWFNPTFKLYLLKEYQRLKEFENDPLKVEWKIKRILSKTNYHLHTDAIKRLYTSSIQYAKRLTMANICRRSSIY